jgi:hypothetical protein
MRIVILGGYGMAGRALARRLMKETDDQVVLAGRNLARAKNAAQQIVTWCGSNRVEAVQADAADSTSILAVLKGAQLLIVASSTAGLAPIAARAAMSARVDYLDIQFSPKKLAALRELAPEIEESGRCFITEAGFHPGLAAAIVRYGARRLERLDKAVVGSVLNQKGGMPYTSGVDELMELFMDYKARVFKDGQWKSWAKAGWKTLRMRFGEAMGTKTCYPMDLAEMEELPILYPSLKETGFYVAGFNFITDYLITPFIMFRLKVSGRKVFESTGRLLCWATRVFSRPPHGIVLKAELTGMRNKRPRFREITFFHEDGYEFTAIPVVASILQWKDPSLRKPGLHLMGTFVDPQRLVQDMMRMGVSVHETE